MQVHTCRDDPSDSKRREEVVLEVADEESVAGRVVKSKVKATVDANSYQRRTEASVKPGQARGRSVSNRRRGWQRRRPSPNHAISRQSFLVHVNNSVKLALSTRLS